MANRTIPDAAGKAGLHAKAEQDLAQIQLAELYTAEGKTDLAHKIYATLEDKDKNSKGKPDPAAAIAKEKLNPAPAGGPPQL